ncbi:hypothetical protein ACKWTF_005062 [Chironomus riparius]
MIKYISDDKTNMRTRNRKKYIKIMQFLSAFLCGIIISELYGRYKCDLKNVDEVDNNNYLLLNLVLSAPRNFERRDAMRETWLGLRPWQINGTSYQDDMIIIPKVQTNGFLEHESIEQQEKVLKNFQKWFPSSKNTNSKEPNLKIKTLFVVGIKGLDKNVAKKIRAESKVYNDLLLLENLQDSYKNLTYKLLLALNKLNVVTPNFNYLLKCDDDTYVKLDYLALDLIQYDIKLKEERRKDESVKNLGLYWGFFNGRASVQKTGQWKEVNYDLCDRYLPYALGGGYVLSKNLVEYLASQYNVLNRYESEDISVGTWLAPFRHIHKRHDPRFDTTYIPRKCQDYHLVLHKRTANDMKEIAKGNLCFSEVSYESKRQPAEYFYNWFQSPSKCCDRNL